MLLPLLAFAFASLLVAGVAMMLAPSSAVTMERRLEELTGGTLAEHERGQLGRGAAELFRRLGALAPRSTSELSKLHQRLIAAGYRGQEALVVFFGIRIGVALTVFTVMSLPLVMRPNLV